MCVRISATQINRGEEKFNPKRTKLSHHNHVHGQGTVAAFESLNVSPAK